MRKWCRPEDLNPQPTDYKSVALPIELGRLSINGGGCRARTCDPLLVRQVLSQLRQSSIVKHDAWRRPTLAEAKPQLPSALKSLTTVFEMGTGVTSSL